MAEMKSEQEQKSDDHPKIDHPFNNHQEDSSDGASNLDTVSGTSTDDDPIVTPAAVAAVAAGQQTKRPLSKQPSNGIHVLKPDGLPNQTANTDTTLANGVDSKSKDQAEEITFDPNGSYYMANACCELLHYRTAAILVGVIELVLIAAWGILIGYYYSKSGINSFGAHLSIGLQAVIAAVFLVIIILMMIGVMAERAYLLWPHMVAQIIGIALGIGFTIIAVIAMCAGTSLAESIFSHIYGQDQLPMVEKALGPIWPFCLAVVFDFGAALGIWFYIVIKGCYEYLMDKAFFEKQLNNVHSLTLKKVNLETSSKKPS